MNSSRRPRAPFVLAGACAASLLVLTGCGSLEGRVEQAQQDFGKAMLPSIAIGECTNLEGTSEQDEQISDIPTVACDTPHKWEAYAEWQLDLAAEFPGLDALTSQAEDFCLKEFDAYIGTRYDDSELDLIPVTPTEDGWDRLRDRTVTCLVGLESGVTGTLKDSKR